MLTRTELLDQASRLRRDAVAAAPGRTASLIDVRVAQLLQMPDSGSLPSDLTDAEQLVVDLTDQFLVDVHGISDQQFGRLGGHYSADEQIAIMFHLAFADGFSKLAKVHPDSADVVETSFNEESP